MDASDVSVAGHVRTLEEMIGLIDMFSDMKTGVLIPVIVVGAVALGVYVYRSIDATLRNSYAVWWVADMVIVHLAANEQQWPRSWDELRDDYATCVKQSGKPWTFEELSRRVMVDWNANTRSLDEAIHRGEDFKVIWLSDGSNDHWERREPNQKIRDYLANRPADALKPDLPR